MNNDDNEDDRRNDKADSKEPSYKQWLQVKLILLKLLIRMI